jgi:uncharacterized glyoxalase superfamily protein PhnB
MPWVSPYLTVTDAAAAVEFYQRAFGFTKRTAMTGPDGVITHAELTWNDAVIMLGPEGAYGGVIQAPATSGTVSPVTLYVYCADVDALYARAVAAGARTEVAPEKTFWGDRMCRVLDPDGHAWCFATAGAGAGASAPSRPA